MSLDISLRDQENNVIYEDNITHNLNQMAAAAGLYKALWRPDENGWFLAEQIIPQLREGLRKLEAYPHLFEKYNPENGWGNYTVLVQPVTTYLHACQQYPTATIQVWR